MAQYLAAGAALAVIGAIRYYFKVHELTNTVEQLERRNYRYQSILERACRRRRSAFASIFHELDREGKGYLTPQAAIAAARTAGSTDTELLNSYFSPSQTQVQIQAFIDFMLAANPDDMSDSQIQVMLAKFNVVVPTSPTSASADDLVTLGAY